MLPSRNRLLQHQLGPGVGLDQYAYQPLQQTEIRVLVLLPGQRSAPLRARLQTVCLDYPPRYKAISYAWGESGFPRTLYLENGVRRITESLFGALRRFRGRKRSVTLWSDAVCINQDDVVEKNHQVAIMGRVYSLAQEVVVWLGESIDTDSMAFWMTTFMYEAELPPHYLYYLPTPLKDGRRVRVRNSENDRLFNASLKRRNRTLLRLLDAEIEAPGRKLCPCCAEPVAQGRVSATAALCALAELWARPWFLRLWVLQEVTLARSCTFYSGRHNVSFEKLMCAASLHFVLTHCDQPLDECSGRHNTLTSRAWLTLNNIISIKREGGGSRAGGFEEFLESLLLPYSKSTSNPYDRVYAVRALSFIQDEEALKPDYKLPLEELWRRVVIAVLNRRTQYDIASAAVMLALPATQNSGSRLAHLPSWIVDLQALNVDCVHKYAFYTQAAQNHRAGGEAKHFHVQPDDHPGIINVRGYMASRIDAILENSQRPRKPNEDDEMNFNDFWELLQKLVSWYLRIRAFAFYTTGNSQWQILRNSMDTFITHGRIIGAVNRGYLKPAKLRYGCEVIVQEALRIYPTLNVATVDASRMAKDLSPFLTAAAGTSHYGLDITRIVAATSDGRLAWVPEASREGDYVYLLEGAPFPFILRSNEDGNVVVGDAYVLGTEHGEAWPEEDDEIEMIKLK